MGSQITSSKIKLICSNREMERNPKCSLEKLSFNIWSHVLVFIPYEDHIKLRLTNSYIENKINEATLDEIHLGHAKKLQKITSITDRFYYSKLRVKKLNFEGKQMGSLLGESLLKQLFHNKFLETLNLSM
jgi:hypothetical protein